MLLAALFFGVALVFYVYRALHNDRGLIINGLIELETSGATVFYWVFAAASAAFVLIGAWGLLQRWQSPRYLVFDEVALSIPARWSKKVRVVPYASIQTLELVSLSGQKFVQLTTSTGKASIAAIMLASEDELVLVAAELKRRIEAAKGTAAA